MGLKDFWNSTVSYFGTDDVSELEEFEEQVAPPARPSRQEPVGRPVRQQEMASQRPQANLEQQRRTKVEPMRPLPPVREGQSVAGQREAVTIALKYPRKYEDAREIVALLNSNECVLIDFQYMLETQARRCLDFIDGASEVLSGNLQKVGSSMYLLTPSSVVVDIEDMQIPTASQDSSFDYDMKRR